MRKNNHFDFNKEKVNDSFVGTFKLVINMKARE